MILEVDQAWVPKTGRYPDNVFVIHHLSQDHVFAHPAGGGPEIKWDSKEFLEEFRRVDANDKKALRPGVFSLEDLDLAIAGWTTGETWNGWAKPVLEAGLFARFVGLWNHEFAGTFKVREADKAFALAAELGLCDEADQEACWVKPGEITLPDGSVIQAYTPDNGWTWWEHDEFEIAYLNPEHVIVPDGFPIKIGGGVVGDG